MKVSDRLDGQRAVYIERCPYGSGGGMDETAGESQYGATVPTS